MERFNYLFLITIWAMPLIVLQWLIGLDVLLRRWKVWLAGSLIPALYLSVVAAFALGGGTWAINAGQTLRLTLPILNIPAEEALFFLVTSTLLTQSVILAMSARQLIGRVRGFWYLLRRGPKVWRSLVEEVENEAAGSAGNGGVETDENPTPKRRP